jgi:purine-nucleoside phosphorylase
MSHAPSSPSALRLELDHTLQFLRDRLPKGAAPSIGLILGSGLGPFAETLEERTAIPFSEIPGFAASTVVGHAGNLIHGVVTTPRGARLEVLAMQGRIHYYEGHDIARVAFPARVLVAAGCKALILTNAAGGIDRTMRPGEIVVISDHLNLMTTSLLRGPNDESIGPRFPDMTAVYDPALRQLAQRAASSLGTTLREGIYAALPGPSYETPAEVRMLRILGAELVGMSTVPEAIAAVHMGARVLGLSCVTNLAAGVTGQKLSHDEVTETARGVRRDFERLLGTILAMHADEGLA